MNRIIGRKKFSKHEDWLKVYKNPEAYVSLAEVQEAEAAALKDIKSKLQRFSKPIYGYSGGKDSIVLAELCRKAGVNVGVMSITELEYPAFDKWVREHIPANVKLISTGQDLDWLKKHPKRFLYKKEDRTDVQSPENRKIQHRFYDEYGADVILLGRRKADGNFSGKNGSNIYSDPNGRTKFNPILDWPHELLLGYIHYNNLDMPPIYDWPDGFIQGTHPWFYREVRKDIEQTLREIHGIDSTLLAKVADVFPVVADFLKKI